MDHDDPRSSAALWEAFHAFHRANPHVYALFKRFAFEAIKAGRDRYSARSIWHRMRWHLDFETTEPGYKLNDHHTPYYARLFMQEHPEHAGFFELRAVQGVAS